MKDLFKELGITPGPWRVDKSHKKDIQTESEETLEICTTTDSVLIGGDCPSHEEQLNNANLIAAAPEMLKALISISKKIEQMKESPGLLEILSIEDDISIIEKACYPKKWDEIKGLIG
jgi:hypothetical protein